MGGKYSSSKLVPSVSLTLSFFTMPLAAFPKTFGLTELKKGFFPHFFNTPANQSYVGPLPDRHFYHPDGMSLKKRQEFDRWYDEQIRRQANDLDYHFYFQQELVAYCHSSIADS